MACHDYCGYVSGGVRPGAISRVEVHPTQPTACDTGATPNVCGVSDLQPVWFNVRGKGDCSPGPVFVQCGNGRNILEGNQPFNFGQPTMDAAYKVICDYRNGWPGPKIVRAYSNGQDCIGEATLRVNVLRVTPQNPYPHMDFQLGYGQPLTTACNTVPSVTTPLRAGTLVAVRNVGAPQAKINFGCLLNGCVYDADGEPGSVAPAGFPFPGLKKYSLVLRVGQQVEQGGTNKSFTTNQGGPLEVCVNDDVLPDNTGAWGIGISVDESQSL